MIKPLLGVARVNFLTLTLVTVALAAAASWQTTDTLDMRLLSVVLLIALSAHVSANAFNEYFDYKSGLDFLTQRTPFSGGSGALVATPAASGMALGLALLTLAITVAGGLYLSFLLRWQLLFIGVPGVALIYTYTQYVNRSTLLCLLAPGVGFGLLMTLGSYWVLAGSISAGAVAISLIMTLLVSNLLLLNQFPDVEADQQVGRYHLPIAIGRPRSARLFAGLLITSYVVLIGAVTTRVLPVQILLALLTLALLPQLLGGIFRYADQPDRLTPYLGLNVALCHLYPLLMALGLIWAGTAS